jgi:hypothetical protein
VVNATPQPLDTRERSTVSILQESRWVPGAFWTSDVKRKSPTLTEIESRIIQPEASQYASGNSSTAGIFDTKHVTKMRNED